MSEYNFTYEFINTALKLEQDVNPSLTFGKQSLSMNSAGVLWLRDLSGSTVFSCSNKEIFFDKLRSIAAELRPASKPERNISGSFHISLCLDPSDTRTSSEIIDELTNGISALKHVHSVGYSIREVSDEVI